MLLAPITPDSQLINLDLIRLIPVMTTRMIISLKKVASKPQSGLNFVVPSGLPININDYRSTRQMDDIQLSVIRGERRLTVRWSHLYEGSVLKLTNLSSSLESEPSRLRTRLRARGLQMIILTPMTVFYLHRSAILAFEIVLNVTRARYNEKTERGNRAHLSTSLRINGLESR